MPPAPAPSNPLPPQTGLPQGPRRPFAAALTFDDLVADLVWPRLLRAAPLALRPARVGLGIVQVLGLLILDAALRAWLGRDGAPDTVGTFSTRAAGLIREGRVEGLRGIRWGALIHEVFVGFPATMLRDHPLAVLVLLPIALGWLTLWGGAISRSAACDHAQGVSISWPQAVGFALSKWRALALSLALPLLLVWLIAAALAVGGWALFSLNYVNVLGGLLWGLFLVAGIVGAIVMVAFAVGHPMLVPAIACEATDAVDAMQHAYSFVFARPARLVAYTLLLVVQGMILLAVVGGVLWIGVHLAQWSATAWSGPRGAEVLGVLPGHPEGATPPTLTGAPRVAHGLAVFWTGLVALIPLGVLASYVWTASTVLYLAMRRVVDGQDESDLWMPGLVEGVMAPAPARSTARAAEGVSDTGPADET